MGLYTISARNGQLVVEPSLLTVQLPGTHWATNCAIWRSEQTVLDDYSKLVCFRSTSTVRLRCYALCHINPRFTYLHR